MLVGCRASGDGSALKVQWVSIVGDGHISRLAGRLRLRCGLKAEGGAPCRTPHYALQIVPRQQCCEAPAGLPQTSSQLFATSSH